jgi:catalase (peroxidase I)
MKFSIVALTITQIAAFSHQSGGSTLADCPMMAKRNLQIAQDRVLSENLQKRLTVPTIADFRKVKVDIIAALTGFNAFYTSKFRHFGPFFVRLAWHCAGMKTL